MKKIFGAALITCTSAFSFGQLSLDTIKIITQPYHLGYSTYFSPFEGKAGYGGPFVTTTDGGAAAFGDNVLYKFSRSGKEVWQRTIKVPFTEMESQCVAED